METSQPSLFADGALPERPLHDPQEARARLNGMLATLRAAASWPWKEATVRSYREKLWPALLGRLPDATEAARLRAEIEAEIARLDAA